MAADDDDNDDGTPRRRHPRGAPTLRGLPSAPPAERSSRRPSEPVPLGPAREGRVTMDFSGPPLELPEDVDEPEAESLSPEAGLSLDLEELDDLDENTEALTLVDKNPGSQPALDLAAEMAERYALDDFTGALRVAELLLGRTVPHPDAQRIARESRRRLEHLYTSRLGGTARVVEVAMPESEMRWLGLDHRAGFLLSRVDGLQSVEDLLDVSGMLRLEALKTLVELLELGAIRTR